MKNPVPEVAFPYVCDYFEMLLEALLHPQDGVDGLSYCEVVDSGDMSWLLAEAIERKLYERGFIEPCYRKLSHGVTVYLRLTARGYLVALELRRQKRVDAAKPIEYDIV